MLAVTDEDYMRMALDIAKYGVGQTSPNPMVGAVVVKNGHIVGTGWHRAAGTPHAEIHALNMAGDAARGATIYVNLEPCAHYGRTGPCVEAIKQAGIARVVAALSDPNPKVKGKGGKFLREAGIIYEVGCLATEAANLNEVFLTWMQYNRPFVVMKTAMTLDGKIAAVGKKSGQITGNDAKRQVHVWRAMYDGIMVGLNTVKQDNPLLTVRLPGEHGGKNPQRIILDSTAQIPLTANVLTDGAAKTLVAVTTRAPSERVERIIAAGGEVIAAGDGERVDLPELMKILAARNICSVLAEGGGTVNFSLLKAGLVDKVHSFIAPKILGGATAPTPVDGAGIDSVNGAVKLHDVTVKQLGEDILVSGYVRPREERIFVYGDN